MKILNSLLVSVLIFTLSFTSVSYATYAPTANDTNYIARQKVTFARILDVYSKRLGTDRAKAIMQLRVMNYTRTAMRLSGKNEGVSWRNFELSKVLQSLLNTNTGSIVVTQPTKVTPGAVLTTDQKKDIVSSINQVTTNSTDAVTNMIANEQKAIDNGFTLFESSLIAMNTEDQSPYTKINTTNISFCSMFTSDVAGDDISSWSDMPADQIGWVEWKRINTLSKKYISGVTPQNMFWDSFAYERGRNYSPVSTCIAQIRNRMQQYGVTSLTQKDMASLFARLGLKFTPQTTPVYLQVDLKSATFLPWLEKNINGTPIK